MENGIGASVEAFDSVARGERSLLDFCKVVGTSRCVLTPKIWIGCGLLRILVENNFADFLQWHVSWIPILRQVKDVNYDTIMREYQSSTVRAPLTFKVFCFGWTQRLDENGPGREIPRFDGFEQISGSKVRICPSECIGFGGGKITDTLIGEGLDPVNGLAPRRER